jgi:hypothetical protein
MGRQLGWGADGRHWHPFILIAALCQSSLHTGPAQSDPGVYGPHQTARLRLSDPNCTGFPPAARSTVPQRNFCSCRPAVLAVPPEKPGSWTPRCGFICHWSASLLQDLETQAQGTCQVDARKGHSRTQIRGLKPENLSISPPLLSAPIAVSSSVVNEMGILRVDLNGCL